MSFLDEFLSAMLLGFFLQNLAFEQGVCTGNLFKLSRDKSFRRRYFFAIMLLTAIIATLVTHFLDIYIISALQEEMSVTNSIRALLFVIVISAIAIAIEFFMQWCAPTLRKQIGGYISNACLNSGVLAILLINRQSEFSLVQSLLFAFMAVLGFMASVLLMQMLRERILLVRCPETLKGEPIAFLSTAILSFVFVALTDLSLPW